MSQYKRAMKNFEALVDYVDLINDGCAAVLRGDILTGTLDSYELSRGIYIYAVGEGYEILCRCDPNVVGRRMKISVRGMLEYLHRDVPGSKRYLPYRYDEFYSFVEEEMEQMRIEKCQLPGT